MPGDNDSSSSSGSNSTSLPYPLLLCPGSSFIGYQTGLRSSWTVRVVSPTRTTTSRVSPQTAHPLPLLTQPASGPIPNVLSQSVLELDMQQMTCCGRMDALDTPGIDSELVATYFEGHLIDNHHYTFGSQPADSPTPHSPSEQKQWKYVQPFTQHIYPTLKAEAHTHDGNTTHSSMQCDSGTVNSEPSPYTSFGRPQWPSLPRSSVSTLLSPPPVSPSAVTRLLHTSRYLFMRWKEQVSYNLHTTAYSTQQSAVLSSCPSTRMHQAKFWRE